MIQQQTIDDAKKAVVTLENLREKFTGVVDSAWIEEMSDVADEFDRYMIPEAEEANETIEALESELEELRSEDGE